MSEPAQPAPPTTPDDVEGWFTALDQHLFTWFLDRQERLDQQGDLLELGVYLGRSAVLLGRHLRGGERFTVCDLFGSPAPDDANDREVARAYPELTRAAFERNYLAFHERLPVVVQAPTSVITDYVRPDGCRFAHVDASRLHRHVIADLAAARSALQADGIVVCDVRGPAHAPGIASAVWAAVDSDDLNPVCVTDQKLYGTWGDPEPLRAELLEHLAAEGVRHRVEEIDEHPVIRVSEPALELEHGDGGDETERELARLKARLDAYRREVARLEGELRSRKRQVRAIRRSHSYRMGRVLTATPRAVRRITGGS
ncbi:class I SAM-dependent methyltransferase [Actinomadura macrotermitis]|uniref:class I SAM-dependent methyltransferase n=1 Tax=Actinomadura macrotermitis TaxID=2585200 RepID=UPI001A9B7B36|nr:class I SAM-dependent methyltransferase [Actinomadura macrotermitis]